MKYKLVILIVMIMTIITSCAARDKKNIKVSYPDWLVQDSVVYSKLGKSLSNILLSPKEVKCYAVEWVDTVTQDQLEPHFKPGNLIKKLSKEEIALIQYNLISNKENYVNDTIVVMSPYVPCLDFEFTGKKKDKAHILVSLSNFTWTVLYDDKRQFNYNYHSSDFERICDFYLKLKENKEK